MPYGTYSDVVLRKGLFCSLKHMTFMSQVGNLNFIGHLLQRVLNFSRGLFIVSNIFEQSINPGVDGLLS